MCSPEAWILVADPVLANSGLAGAAANSPRQVAGIAVSSGHEALPVVSARQATGDRLRV